MLLADRGYDAANAFDQPNARHALFREIVPVGTAYCDNNCQKKALLTFAPLQNAAVDRAH